MLTLQVLLYGNMQVDLLHALKRPRREPHMPHATFDAEYDLLAQLYSIIHVHSLQ